MRGSWWAFAFVACFSFVAVAQGVPAQPPAPEAAPPPATQPAPAPPPQVAPQIQPQPQPPPPGYGYGQPPQPYPPYPPPYGYGPPPAPPPPPPPGYVHDGFYLRMNLGFAYVAGSVEADEPIGDYSYNGGGAALDILLGGTPATGLVLGGGLFISATRQPNIEKGDANFELDGGISLLMLAVFVDAFFDPTGGFHFGGAVGYVELNVNHETFETLATPSGPVEVNLWQAHAGIGAAVWAGYGGWVGREWQLGGMVRLAAATTESEGSSAATGQSFALLFSALHH